MCGVDWECELDGAGDGDDDILGTGWELTEQSKWERQLWPQLKTSYQQASQVKFRSTRRSEEQALGFVERAESESATTVRGNSRFA